MLLIKLLVIDRNLKIIHYWQVVFGFIRFKMLTQYNFYVVKYLNYFINFIKQIFFQKFVPEFDSSNEFTE